VKTSRLPRFYELTLSERRALIESSGGPSAAELEATLGHGGLDPETADKVVENVLGTYALPFGVALNFVLNGVERLVPMVVEEPSVIAAASNAAKMVREGGGFSGEVPESLMIAQVELRAVRDVDAARARIMAERPALLALAASAVPGLVRRGGGPRELEVRELAADHLVVHVLVDCCDAMGANLVNGAAETLGPRLAELSRGTLGLRILSNLTDRRLIRVRASAPGAALARGLPLTAEQVLEAIEAASIFAERDPYRAATHNKGIMNGLDSVVLAAGNDYRAVEAAAHAYAARSGRYAPLAIWRRRGESLEGVLELPLALGTVGGTLRVHPAARLALRLAGIESARDLALLAGAAGLASNLAALRALATEGIQRGHMSLHARSVAIAAGATGDEVEQVAARLAERGTFNPEAAASVLAALRAPNGRR
jgi:hydroxymethylglutaryl-CoA reductase